LTLFVDNLASNEPGNQAEYDPTDDAHVLPPMKDLLPLNSDRRCVITGDVTVRCGKSANARAELALMSWSPSRAGRDLTLLRIERRAGLSPLLLKPRQTRAIVGLEASSSSLEINAKARAPER